MQVWAARLEAAPARLERAWQLLDGDERRRAESFVAEIHRTRFVLSHGFLREVLARYLGVEGRAIAFHKNASGKPLAAGIEFSLAHSGEIALAAVAAKWHVGVDVERIHEISDIAAVARRCFSPREREVLDAAGVDETAAVFFQTWVRKEAYIKALGSGMALELDSFDACGDVGDFRILPLPEIRGYAGALAVEGPADRVQCWEWHWE